jgi:outer membrane protein TolC
MKSAFALTVAGAILVLSAGCTSVQEAQQSAQPSARATMLENANASAQHSRDVSYGGVPDTRTATGGARSPSSPTCATRLKCDLFSKH